MPVTMDELEDTPMVAVVESTTTTSVTAAATGTSRASPPPLIGRLSQSFPTEALRQALGGMGDGADGEAAPVGVDLSSSCFSAIRLDKGAIEDDELTELNWLHSSDLLKSIGGGSVGDGGERRLEGSGSLSEEDAPKENDRAALLANGSAQLQSKAANAAGVGGGTAYDAKQHVNSKPPFSFSCLIFMAIEDSANKRLPVKDIYKWILEHFPYYKNAHTGWKNSVRHNLSLNKCFKKVDKDKGQTISKGSLWCVDPEFRPNLIQAVKKTPYYPYSEVFTKFGPNSPGTPLSTIHRNGGAYNSNHHPTLGHVQLNRYPYLQQNDIDPDKEADAVAAILTFNTPRDQRPAEHERLKRQHKSMSPAAALQQLRFSGSSVQPKQVANTTFTPRSKPHKRLRSLALSGSAGSAPSEDHTYSLSSSSSPAGHGYSSDEDPLESDLSAGHRSDEDSEDSAAGRRSEGASSPHLGDSGYVHDDDGFDEDYGSDGGKHLPLKKRTRRISEMDEEDVEGADALLNLAGLNTAVPVPSPAPTPQPSPLTQPLAAVLPHLLRSVSPSQATLCQT